MPVRNALGLEVPHARCFCGRHRQSVDDHCCGSCGTGTHTVACAVRQESFADTRRGVTVARDGAVLRVRKVVP